jgi:hypothetical protein
MLMGTGFLLLALVMNNDYLQAILLILSIVLNVVAVIKNFREKRENKL